jgi:hypothetical protein
MSSRPLPKDFREGARPPSAAAATQSRFDRTLHSFSRLIGSGRGGHKIKLAGCQKQLPA